MNSKFFVYFFIFTCTCCAHYQSSVSFVEIRSSDHKVHQQLSKRVEELLTELKSMDLNSQWQEHLGADSWVDFFKQAVHTIDYSPYHCLEGMVACTFSGDHKIYVNDSFMQLNSWAQKSSLLHEAYHIKDQWQMTHIACQKAELKNQLCDQGLFSAYGIELFYLQQISSTDAILQKERELAQKRIN